MSGLGIETPRVHGPAGGALLAVAGVGICVAAVLSVVPGLTLSADLAGLGLFAAVAFFVICKVEATHPHHSFGIGNWITLARAGGAALLAAFLVAPAAVDGACGWAAVALSLVLLALDGVDGWIARRQRLASRFGARFDLEIDALLILTLAALIAALGKTGIWILGLGLMRYAFLLTICIAPRLGRPLYPSLRRKTVCVIQVATLALLLAPPIGPDLAAPLGFGALLLLAWSFARDLRWLLARPRPSSGPAR